MAKVLYSGIGIVDSRGSLDTTVYSKNRYGNFSRARVTPANPFTAKKAFFKSAFATLSQSWALLPQSNRDAWNQAALESRVSGKLSIDYYMSGFNMYIKQTFYILVSGGMSSGLPIPAVNVALPTFMTVDIPNLTTINYNVQFTTGNYQVPAQCLFLLKASVGVSPGINYKRSNITFYDSFDPLQIVNPVNNYNRYLAELGPLTSGTKIFFEGFLSHSITGQRSMSLLTSAIVP